MRTVLAFLLAASALAGCAADEGVGDDGDPCTDPPCHEVCPAVEGGCERSPYLPPPVEPAPPSEDGRDAAARGPGSGVTVLDPLVPGPLAHETAAYDFGLLVVDDPTTPPYQYPVQVTGEVTFPTDWPGPSPLVLLMHGRHGTCAVLGVEAIATHVCPDVAPVVEPVTSYSGYRYLAGNLASHGYVVASINANQVNDRDLLGDAGANARAELALHTLDMFAAVNATGAAGDATATQALPLQGRIDLSRVGVMGHSRGGEGMLRAATMAPERLAAVFALAPTDFARWVVTDVPMATLLPYCDGDVYNLQGAWAYDDARATATVPLYQVVALGANHNFYNTVWTGDDWGTTGAYCGSQDAGSGRDTPEGQRAHGLAVMASFLRMHVGGEAGFAPYWTGAAAFPAAACPDWDGCGHRLLVSRHGPGALVVSADGGSLEEAQPGQECVPADCGLQPTYGTATQRYVAEGTAASILFPVAWPEDGERFDVLTLRVATFDGATLHVRVAGQDIPLQHAALDPAPGDESTRKAVLSMVRVPLADVPQPFGVLELRIDGGLQLADVLLQDEA